MSERPGIAGLRGLPAQLWANGPINRIALVACALWVVLVLSYAAGYFGGDGERARGTAFLDAVFFVVALLLPIGLVALAAWLAAELVRQRAATAALVGTAGPLAAALAETRTALAQEGPVSARDIERAVRSALVAAEPELVRQVAERLDAPLQELREGQQALDRRLGALATARAARSRGTAGAGGPPNAPRAPQPEAEAQPALPSLAAEPDVPLGWDELIRALDFPRDAADRDGFAALKRALRHHSLAQMLQAAEDVMNLLSQEGVYMDDLHHEPGPPEAWRDFIAGRRGEEVAAVGGIRDERALDAVRGLMKTDPIFRDTALFLQRRFVVVLDEFTHDVGDDVLMALADTRSGRAFMLCARASGSFG